MEHSGSARKVARAKGMFARRMSLALAGRAGRYAAPKGEAVRRSEERLGDGGQVLEEGKGIAISSRKGEVSWYFQIPGG